MTIPLPTQREMVAASLQGTMVSSRSLIKITVYLCITLLLIGCSSTQFRSDPKGIGYIESGVINVNIEVVE